MSNLDAIKVKAKSNDKRMKANYALAFGVAIISDMIDYGIGSVPVVGDILDVITISILYRLIGPLSLSGLIELIPALDILPAYTISVIVSWLAGKKNRSAQR